MNTPTKDQFFPLSSEEQARRDKKPESNKQAFVKEVIYQVLSGAEFEKWWENKFYMHLTGMLEDGEAVPKSAIMADIEKMFLSNVDLS